MSDSQYTTPQRKVNPLSAPRRLKVATASELPTDLPGLDLGHLLLFADLYHKLGWRPFPLTVTFDAQGKKTLRPPRWQHLKAAPLSWDQTESLFAQWGGKANAVASCLEPGHYVADADNEQAQTFLADLTGNSLPQATSAGGRGCHLHFATTTPFDFGEQSKDLAPGLHILGPGKLVLMPPTLNIAEWTNPPSTTLPGPSPTFRMVIDLAQRAGSTTTTPAPRTSKAPIPRDLQPTPPEQIPPELRLLLPLIPDLTTASAGKTWIGTCPFPAHPDTSPSFGIFHGKTNGAWIGHCFGCGRTATLRDLRGLLRDATGDTLADSYRRAFSAIDALPDTDPATTAALIWIVTQAQTHNLDFGDHAGIGASYAQLARATGLEKVNDAGRLSGGGRSIAYLIKRLEGVGVTYQRGTPDQPGKKGTAGRVTLPAAWTQAFRRLTVSPSPYADPTDTADPIGE